MMIFSSDKLINNSPLWRKAKAMHYIKSTPQHIEITYNNPHRIALIHTGAIESETKKWKN